jgi:hypothetical protein
LCSCAQYNEHTCFIKSWKFLHYLTTMTCLGCVLHHGTSYMPRKVLALTFGYVKVKASLTTPSCAKLPKFYGDGKSLS